MQESTRENVQVIMRIRPQSDKEDECILYDTENNIDIYNSNSSHRFTFDRIFNQDVDQEDIFNDSIKQSIIRVTEGYNASIFAYGATGTGKTYTMFGHDKEYRGIIPRCAELLFHVITECENTTEFTIKCSFLEIYREHVRDLLITEDTYLPSLRLRQDVKGVYVQGLIEKHVYTPKDILSTIKHGAQQRTTASTNLNDVSSRSHAVLILTISQTQTDGTEIVSKLNLIDLAGSENVGKSGSVGTTLLEAQTINKSLSALGNVIYALTEKGREHIPYRDSKLTFLLQDSLGGNSRTIMISTVMSNVSSYAETLNTLKFSKRAKEIKNTPKINRYQSRSNLKKTIASLRKQLQELQIKYEDSQAIIEKVQRVEVAVDMRQITLLQARCERIQRHNACLELQQIKDKDRYDQLKIIFNKQRDLACHIATDLYTERNRNCHLSNEIEQYKILYESLTDCLTTPNVLEMVVRNTKIRKSSLSIDVTNSEPISVEIDSPQ
jgi:kinesin family member 5